MRHATKYYLKSTLAGFVTLAAFFMLPYVGIDKANMGLSFLLGGVVFWIVWPSVWNTKESTKSEIISYKIFGVLVAAIAFVYQQFAT